MAGKAARKLKLPPLLTGCEAASVLLPLSEFHEYNCLL